MLFALLVFALLAVAALSVDVGLAQLTQAQMQDAVDSAALEGLRWRQYTEEHLVPFFSNPIRREKASEMLALVFDDDLDPAADAAHYGAGPVLERSGALGTLGGVLAVPEPPVWDPRLARNGDDLAGGDIVSGTFDASAPGAEGPDYSRADFQPASSAASGLGPALLVRLRRTGAPSPEDDVPGAATHGPGLPLLFAHGAPIRADGGGDEPGWDPRRDGLTVRATAVGALRPALSIGATPLVAGERVRQLALPGPDSIYPAETLQELAYYDHLGVSPFVVTLGFWTRYTLEDPACVVVGVDSAGVAVLRLWDPIVQQGGEIVGWFEEDVRQVGREARRLGGVGPPAPMPARIDGFLPVVARVDAPDGSSPWRVIGFGHARLSDPSHPDNADVATNCPLNAQAGLLTFSKLDTRVPVTGADAGFVERADPLSPAEWARIFQLNAGHFDADRLSASILAPALAR